MEYGRFEAERIKVFVRYELWVNVSVTIFFPADRIKITTFLRYLLIKLHAMEYIEATCTK